MGNSHRLSKYKKIRHSFQAKDVKVLVELGFKICNIVYNLNHIEMIITQKLENMI